jgi:ectoine hydroxylase-related dioxygenase (phytanoyl-CoA dioxygenase family)
MDYTDNNTAPPRFDAGSYIQRIRSEGYTILENVIAADEATNLLQAIASITDSDAVLRKGNIYGVRNLLELCPAVRQLAVSPSIRRLATLILGEACFAVRAIFFDKAPDANWKLGWHQDSVISVHRRLDVPGFIAWSNKAGVLQVQPPANVLSQMLSIRVHLDDCQQDNGPLRVIPGSHTSGWLDDALDDWKKLVPEVSCHVSVGGVVVMRPLLLHASAAAARPTHRRVIHIEFACEDLPDCLEWNQRLGPGAAGQNDAT